MKIKSGFVQVNDIRIHYERTGGEKPPMVLCHGVTDNGRCMLRLAEYLADRYDVILVDARGHGLSDKPDPGQYTTDHHVEDINGLAAALELHKPLCYGHSMGARSLVRLAAKYPDLPKAIALEDPIFVSTLSGEQKAARDLWFLSFAEEIRQWNTMSAEALFEIAQQAGHRDWTPDEMLEWAKSKLQVSPHVLGYDPVWDAIAEDLPRIICPVLILKADGGVATRKRDQELAARLPDGKLIHVEGAGHNVRRENWAELTRHLDEFLAINQP